MTDALMTSIVLKSNVTLMDIVSTRMLGQFGFLAKVSVFCHRKAPCSSRNGVERKRLLSSFFMLAGLCGNCLVRL